MFKVKMMTRDEFERTYPTSHEHVSQWTPEQIERAKGILGRPINKLPTELTDMISKWRALALTSGKG